MKTLQTILVCALLAALPLPALAQTPLGTEFTYQGRLNDAGSPADGLHDLRFRLYDAAAGGAQVGDTLCANNVSMTDGLFTVPLDFGGQFAGEERFLEVEVRADTGLDCANPAGFIVLVPRQALSAAPNALFALNAAALTLPYSQSIVSGSDAFSLINAGNGGALRGESNTGTGVYAKQTNSGNFGYLGSDSYGLYAKHASSGNYGWVGSSGWAIYGKHGVSNNYGYIGNNNYGVYGQHGASLNYGFFGNTDFGVYGEHGATLNFGFIGADKAAVYGQTGNNRTFGFLADDENGAGGQYVLNNNAGYLGTPTRGVYGVHGATGNYGYLGSSDYGVYGVVAGPTYGFLGSSLYGMLAGHSSGSKGHIASSTYGAYAAHGGSSNFGYLGSSTYGAYAKHNASANYGYIGATGEAGYFKHNASGSFARLADSTYGVYAQAGPDAIGAIAVNTASGWGVWGTGNTYGVYGLSGVGRGVFGTSVSDIGVYGSATEVSGSNYGMWAESASTSGRGIFATASASSGTTYGVRGSSQSPNGYGLYSLNSDARVDGDLTVIGAKVGYVADIVLNGDEQALQPGDVVEIAGVAEPVVGRIPTIVVRKTRSAGSRGVLGPVECALRLTPFEESDREDAPSGKTAERWHVHRSDGVIPPGGYGRVVTLGAFEMINVDASRSAVRPGDLLVSSGVAGYAMAAQEPKIGTVIGKALGSLDKGRGTIQVMVSPR